MFDHIVVGGDYTEGVQSRRSLRAIPRPMSRGHFIAETTFERPAIICGMTLFSTKFAMVDVSRGFLSPAYVFLDHNFFWEVFVCREVDNNKFGTSNTIWSVSDQVVIILNDCTREGRDNGRWQG